MPKKIDEAEVKKECPSCGLGVSLDSTVCEFCGWDFDEEDEWILQIEKLERDLMMEKQRFEPGTVNDKIESTLHAPALEMQSASRTSPKTAPAQGAETAKKAPPSQAPKRATSFETKKAAPVPEPIAAKQVPQVASPQMPVSPKAPDPVPQDAPSGKVRRMRIVKAATPQEASKEETGTKRRLVRKVKQG